MNKLSKRTFSYTISWKGLREIGIDLGKLRRMDIRNIMVNSDHRWRQEKERILGILKQHMPEMIRIKGYDVMHQPILTLDYFFKYINWFLTGSTIQLHKPSGRYLYNEKGYRVLVDENDVPITNMKGVTL